jgi:hypothetical protein
VALAGDTALVGAPGDADPNGELAGSAYVFDRSKGWERRTKLSAGDGGFLDRFGTAVALDGGTALVGAENGDGNGDATGVAYAYDV